MTEATSPATANTIRMVAPHLVCDGAADAIEFYKKAFGAEEMTRLPGPDGRLMHAALKLNGAIVMLVDENKTYGMLGPKALGGTPVTIHLNVPDVDAATERAVAAGAEVTMPVADMFWGDRYGQIKDPFGHSWSIATPLRAAPLTEAELQEAAKRAFAPA
ncbi:MAG: VOC family protein [Sphingomonadaceae bacterium]|nr:VOC family protein [Sphingomonadaceae bacterium]